MTTRKKFYLKEYRKAHPDAIRKSAREYMRRERAKGRFTHTPIRYIPTLIKPQAFDSQGRPLGRSYQELLKASGMKATKEYDQNMRVIKK